MMDQDSTLSHQQPIVDVSQSILPHQQPMDIDMLDVSNNKDKKSTSC